MKLQKLSLLAVVSLFSFFGSAIDVETRGFKGTVGVFCFDAEGRALPVTSNMNSAQRRAVQECLDHASSLVPASERAEHFGPAPTAPYLHAEGFIDRAALRRAEEALLESELAEPQP